MSYNQKREKRDTRPLSPAFGLVFRTKEHILSQKIRSVIPNSQWPPNMWTAHLNDLVHILLDNGWVPSSIFRLAPGLDKSPYFIGKHVEIRYMLNGDSIFGGTFNPKSKEDVPTFAVSITRQRKADYKELSILTSAPSSIPIWTRQSTLELFSEMIDRMCDPDLPKKSALAPMMRIFLLRVESKPTPKEEHYKYYYLSKKKTEKEKEKEDKPKTEKCIACGKFLPADPGIVYSTPGGNKCCSRECLQKIINTYKEDKRAQQSSFFSTGFKDTKDPLGQDYYTEPLCANIPRVSVVATPCSRCKSIVLAGEDIYTLHGEDICDMCHDYFRRTKNFRKTPRVCRSCGVGLDFEDFAHTVGNRTLCLECYKIMYPGESTDLKKESSGCPSEHTIWE